MPGHPTFGTELRRLRVAAGLSLAGLAAATYYSKGHLSKVEAGKARPNEKLASVCERALNAGGVLTALVASVGRPGPGRRWSAADLPYDTVHFTGRDAELARIMTLLCPEAARPGVPAVCAIDGMAGIGKTALGIHAAHRLVGRFPDGSLFLDLHGYTGNIPQVSPADALDRLLRRLGVPGEQIPEHVDDRAALYRSRLAGKRMLIILDNARSTEQIRPLLPATPGCGVVITSRMRLTALDDASHLSLATLPPAEAAALFRSVAGDRGADSPKLVDRIVESCGRLPLAIRIAAARCRDGVSCRLADLDRRLADGQLRLDELEDGERNVTAVFTVSYETLPDELRRTFALLDD
jgi:hypothetical protein